MKIMIAYPPLEGKGTPMLGQNRQFQWFNNPSFIYPMVPASAATLLKERGYNVIWKDAIAEGWGWEQFEIFFRGNSPDLIAIETKTPVVKKHWNVIKRLKDISPDTGFVLMGDHVTARPMESMDNSLADFAVTGGNYDFQLLGLADYIKNRNELPKGIYYRDNGSIKNTGRFELNNDLNELPFIDRELTKWHLYGEPFYKRPPFTYTMVGRDCPYAKCTFCSWTTTHPRFKARAPDSLLDEIGILIDKYGIREIFDDTGTFPSGAWLERFCNGMIERGYNKKILLSCNFRFDYITEKRAGLMKRAGFRLMKMGLESANQKTLDRLNKGIKVEDITKGCRAAKRAGLEVHLTIMVGFPWETRKDAENTFELAKFLMTSGYADMLQSTVAMPYPGTPLYDLAVSNNWFMIDPEDYEQFDMTAPILNTPDMTSKQIMEMCDRIYKVFLAPKYICRQFFKIRSIEDITYLARGIKPVFGHIKDFARQPGFRL